MSCIATAITKSGYEMASDSYFFSGTNIYRVNNKKIYNISDILIGSTSSGGSSMINILEEIQYREYNGTLEDKALHIIKDINFILNTPIHTNFYAKGWEILINSGECIYHLCESGKIQISERYAVIGSGKEYALGAMDVIIDSMDRFKDHTIGWITERAVMTARNYCTNAGGDIQSLIIERK
jgi:ATP-dependent protease HslVU (ClpYQ) peptidase subunit